MSQQIFWKKVPLSAPPWGKSLKSFFFLQCWGVVGWLFVGAGMEGLFFFGHRTSFAAKGCALGGCRR